MFVFFFVIAWGLSYFVAALDAMHKFPEEIFGIIQRIEVWMVYADAALCGVVLMTGAIRFCTDLIEVRKL